MFLGRVETSRRGEQTRCRKAVGGGSAAFAESLKGVIGDGNTGPTPVRGTSPLSALFSLQEIGSSVDESARRRTIARGEALLDGLERLRRDVLAGVLSPERLSHLSETLRARAEATADPLLREIMEDIELRAEVELAKWEAHG